MHAPEVSSLFVLGISLIFFELLFGAVSGLDIFFLGVAFVLGGVIVVFGLPLISVVIISVVFYLIYILFLRRLIRRTLILFLQNTGVVDTLVGREARIVFFDKKTKKAQALIHGEIWDGFFRKTPTHNKLTYVFSCKNSVLEFEEDTA